MPRERPLVERFVPSSADDDLLRGIVSPCTGCKNNIPIPVTIEESEALSTIERNNGRPCPKQFFYARQRLARTDNIVNDVNLSHPVFDQSLKGVNPVWPGHKKHCNPYAYIFVATFEDNVDSGINPAFDTERIICRGPYLIMTTERDWNFRGHLEQGDSVLVFNKQYSIDGMDFKGFIKEVDIWQTARGYMREIDTNLLISLSAIGTL